MNKHSKNVTLNGIRREYVAPDKTLFRAVDDVSLEIRAGEFVTLLGPSGCGKTTTLRMIAGFEKPSAGTISIGDEIINHLTPDKRDTAMVFQSYALFPHYNVYNNISFGLRLKSIKESDITRKVRDIMELVGLNGLEDRFPNQLSGGQQQRVALARALVMEPGVLLFDEPLSNLDAKLRVSMRNEIKKIQRRLGLTSIYVTHDQTEAMAVSDRVIVMNHGKIEQIGTPHEIYDHPVSRFVADFIGRSNFFEGKVLETEGKSISIELFGKTVHLTNASEKPRNPGDSVTIMARPESLLLGREGIWNVTVTSSIFMGTHQEYIVDFAGGSCIIEDHDFLRRELYAEDAHAMLACRPGQMHIL